MNEIKNLLKEKANIVDKTLEEIMEITDPDSRTLHEAMKYTLFSGGKRIRPILTMMVAEMISGNLKIAKKVGAAIELIHTYSLIHDDLPSMDDDDYRRGELTNHKVYGPGISILAGDALLTYSFQVLSKLDFSKEKLLKIIEIIADSAGINGMVGGQVLDLEAEESDINLEELRKIHEKKTGALIRCSILAGAYCGQPEPVEIEFLKDYAHYLGILFQIVDDILDVIGDADKMGKSVGQDQQLNKSTYPELLGLKGAQKEAEKMAKKADNSLNIFGEKAADLKLLTDFVLNRQY